MQRVRKLLHIDAAEKRKLTGAGIGVGVLDSGVLLHDDFTERVALFRNFTLEGGQKIQDETGHGTHVCGIIAGSGRISGGKYRGIAPGSHLCVGKILNHKGEGDVSMMIHGLEWLLSEADKQNIKVINISVSSLYFSKENEKVFRLFEQAYRRNILIVTAAGNSGPGGSTVSKLGDSPYVICVGCHEGKESVLFDKKCQDCSGRGPGTFVYRKPDVVAPGTDIISCSGVSRYVKKSGTSMATPIVAGLLALGYEKEPDASAEEMKRRLIRTTDDLGENFLLQGFGMVNAERFLR
ncbi:MAG: S8 family serine peptidase [Lachnospiraceae bacterium]|nr:S8 family serine peptidase [Lachnospiraceae bacterium]